MVRTGQDQRRFVFRSSPSREGFFAAELHVAEAAPAADDEGLTRLSTWCMRYGPLVAVDRPDGVWIEAAGSAHLFGGEEALLSDLQRRLRRAGVNARAAVADTPGAAWAVARYGSEAIVVPGGMAAAIAELPIVALRLPSETVNALRWLGSSPVRRLSASERSRSERTRSDASRVRSIQALRCYAFSSSRRASTRNSSKNCSERHDQSPRSLAFWRLRPMSVAGHSAPSAASEATSCLWSRASCRRRRERVISITTQLREESHGA
jgi:nucleotidyltransferase/DNA polymerase involved in DNA repair